MLEDCVKYLIEKLDREIKYIKALIYEKGHRLYEEGAGGEGNQGGRTGGLKEEEGCLSPLQERGDHQGHGDSIV
jgi:hypothetical protein